MALCHMCRGSGMLSEAPCLAKPSDLRCVPCAELADLDEKIAELQARRLKMLSNINEEHEPLTNHLPIEICAKIFQQVLPSVDLLSKVHEDDQNLVDGQTPRLRQMSSVPLLISQVCRTWREICHSTPHLWTVLTLYIGGKASPVTSAADTLAWAWIARAGVSLPLSIILFEWNQRNSAGRHPTYFLSVFNLIATNAPRLSYLQATISKLALGELCRRYQDRSSLKTLRVFTLTGGEPGIIDNGPKFRPLRLHISRVDWRWVAIDTSTLTHVEITWLFVSECVALIGNSPLLVSCSFDSPQPPTPFPDNNQPLTHSRLKYLRIWHLPDHSMLAYILSKFNFPSLDSLSLRPAHEGQQAAFVAVVQHLQRSGSSLRTLSFSNLSLQTSEEYSHFTQLIDIMAPMLHELNLPGEYDYRYGDTHKRHLSSFFESLLPRLRNLRSLTVFSPTEEWLYMLRGLLKGSLVLVTETTQQLSVGLWSPLSPLRLIGSHKLTVAVADYNAHDRAHPLKAADVQDMIEIMQHQLVSLEVRYSSIQPLDPRTPENGINISNEVPTALYRLLEKMQG